MAFCSQCGNRLGDGARFCPVCGKPVGAGNNSERIHVFEGTVHKCPNCGEVMNSFQSVCPACGHEFRDASASLSVKDFARKLEELNNSRKVGSTASNVARAFGMGRSDPVDEQIINLVRNYTVPNTKEDVFEFMILASSNINISAISDDYQGTGATSYAEFSYMKALSDAWMAKFEQVYNKARLSFGADPDFIKIQDIYDNKIRSIEKGKKEKKGKDRRNYLMVFLLLMPIFILLGLLIIFNPSSGNSEEEKLEKKVIEIQADIINGDYDSALIKANSLRYDEGKSKTKAKQWDEQRENLIEIIKEKKQEESDGIIQ